MEKDNKIEITKKVVKSAEFKVLEKETDSAILNVLGWRMRVYFDKSLTKEQKEKISKGKLITVKYIGDLEDVFSVELQKLTEVWNK